MLTGQNRENAQEIEKVDFNDRFTKREQKLLNNLFTQYPTIKLFQKNQRYAVKSVTEDDEYNITLSHDILKRKRKKINKENEYRYEVIDDMFAQQGTISQLYEILHTIDESGKVVKSRNLNEDQANDYKIKCRLAKKIIIQNKYEDTKKEAIFNEKFSYLHSKELVIIDDEEDKNIDSAYHAYIVMAQLPYGDLRKFITAHSQLDFSTALTISIHLLEALLFVHEKNILHLDIKPENILIDAANYIIFIIDFGLAVYRNIPLTSMVEGTYNYMPHEQYLCMSQVNEAADIFAMGLCISEVWGVAAREINRTPNKKRNRSCLGGFFHCIPLKKVRSEQEENIEHMRLQLVSYPPEIKTLHQDKTYELKKHYQGVSHILTAMLREEPAQRMKLPLAIEKLTNLKNAYLEQSSQRAQLAPMIHGYVKKAILGIKRYLKLNQKHLSLFTRFIDGDRGTIRAIVYYSIINSVDKLDQAYGMLALLTAKEGPTLKKKILTAIDENNPSLNNPEIENLITNLRNYIGVDEKHCASIINNIQEYADSHPTSYQIPRRILEDSSFIWENENTLCNFRSMRL